MRSSFCLFVAACGFSHGKLPGATSDAAGPDVANIDIDAAPDALGANCFGASPFVVCLQSTPTTEVTLGSLVNTGDGGETNCASASGTVLDVGGTPSCVIAGTNVSINGTVRGVIGPRPLVIVASDTITVGTTNFDISSRTSDPTSDGPHANPSDCMQAASQNGADGNAGGGGGGAGGSFGSQGSDGGSGGGGTLAGGSARAAETSFDKLRGGCPGGEGGNGGDGNANAGSGGGAVYLVARNELSITGSINASGAGGRRGENRGGGGGGGSGGMIVLHAGTLTVGTVARIFANGGGGGGGAGNDVDGENGGDARLADSAAPGGLSPALQGTDGAAGAFKSTTAGTAGQAAHGGGGGGGGVGVIRVLSGQAIPSINVSPTPIVN